MITSLASTGIAAGTIAAHAGPGFVGGFGWLFFLIPLFWIAVFVLVFGLIGRRWRRNAWAGGHPGFAPWSQQASRNAESTLAERFAQGDIDEKEYRARLEVLRANNYPQPGSKA